MCMINKETVSAFVNYRILYDYMTKTKEHGVFVLPGRVETYSIHYSQPCIPCLGMPQSLIQEIAKWFELDNKRGDAKKLLSSTVEYQKKVIWDLCTHNAICHITFKPDEACYIIDNYLEDMVNNLRSLLEKS